MIKINQSIVVEGKYDKIKLESIFDAIIIETDGFEIFKNKQKLNYIKKMAEKNGIIILTDNDNAGFMIRNYLKNCIDNRFISHIYLPDIFGKERRKDKPSKEGKLGVEGIEKEIIINSFKKADILIYNNANDDFTKKVTLNDFYEDGLTGHIQSKMLRKKLLNIIDLPENMSTKTMITAINELIGYEAYKKAIMNLTIIREV